MSKIKENAEITRLRANVAYKNRIIEVILEAMWQADINPETKMGYVAFTEEARQGFQEAFENDD